MRGGGGGRDQPDRCPGGVELHAAADGGLARVRLPGGRLRADRLAVLSTAARELGDPALELTSRANLQVRAVRPEAAGLLARRLFEAGLLPSQTHEKVRNIVASPLSGHDGAGVLDVRPLVDALDAGLCADPVLAGLPGRFLFTLDDGRGDVTPLGGDVGVHGRHLVLGGVVTGLPATLDLLLRAARGFLDERAAQGVPAWRLAELPGGVERVAARLHGHPDRAAGERPANAPGSAVHVGEQTGGQARRQVGQILQTDGQVAVGLVVPLGRLTTEQANELTAVAYELTVPNGIMPAESRAGEIIVTPWRTVVVPDLPAGEGVRAVQRLEATGLIADPSSPWVGVTSCAGRPGCAKAHADVQADAVKSQADAVKSDAGSGEAGRLVHWVGCERRCGSPPGRHVEVLATPDGYEIRLGGRQFDSVAAARGAA